MFCTITKAGQYFQDAMLIYMADFMDKDLVPDTYDYTKLFWLWKGKGSKLDRNNFLTSTALFTKKQKQLDFYSSLTVRISRTVI